GNAIVKLTVSGGTSSQVYKLQTGTSITSEQSGEADYDTTVPYFASSGPGDTTDACAAPNSSGPNSSMSDNCEWTVTPGFNADHDVDRHRRPRRQQRLREQRQLQLGLLPGERRTRRERRHDHHDRGQRGQRQRPHERQ